MRKLSENAIENIADGIVDLILSRGKSLYVPKVGGGNNEQNILKNKRTEHWIAFIRRVTKDEIIFRKGMVKYFKEQEVKALNALGGQKAVDKTIEQVVNVPKKKEELKKLAAFATPKIVQALYFEAINVLEELEISIAFDVSNPKVIEFVETKEGDLIKSISNTTKEALRATLKEGIEAGESIPKLAKRVSEVYEDAKGYRATLIARTECITAHNNGALNGYRQSEVVEKKSWLTAGDERVRPEHAAMDGETVGLDEAFSNGLMYPSEPNCRCTIIPIVSKE